MHELGVVFYVIDNLKEVAKENNLEKINRVTIQIGEVSTVIPDQLLDVWEWAKKKHPLLSETEMAIERIPAVTFCTKCEGKYSTLEYGKTCPYCGSEETYLEQGDEFAIRDIEVLDEEPES